MRHILTMLIAGSIALGSGLAQAQPAPSAITALLRGIDADDPALMGSAARAPIAEGDEALPDPDALSREAASGPPDLGAGLELVESMEAWHRRMTRGGADRFVLVGQNSPETRVAARAVVALCAAATALLDRAIEAEDRASDSGRKEADDDRLERALHARQVVLPLRAARAAVIVASSSPNAEPRLELAAQALESALRVEPVSSWSEAERFTVSGWALLILKKPAEALTAFQKSRASPETKATMGPTWSGFIIEGALGEAIALLDTRGPVTARESLMIALAKPPFLDSDRVDVPAFLAGADLLIRIAPLEAATFQDGVARTNALSRPWLAAEQALSRLDFGGRGALYAHMGVHISSASLVERLPESARVAWAWSELSKAAPDADLAQRTLAPLADPARPPTTALQQDAYRLFARAGAMSEDPVVLERVCRVAQVYLDCCAQNPGIGELLDAAAHSAERRIRLAHAPDDGAKAQEDFLEALRALALAPIMMDEGERDPWRIVLGRVLLRLVSTAPIDEAAALAEESRDMLRRVSTSQSLEEARTLIVEIWIELLRVAEDSESEESPVTKIAGELAGLCSAGSNDELSAIGRARAFLAVHLAAEALDEVSPYVTTGRDASPRALDTAMETQLALEHEAEARALAARSPTAALALAQTSRRGWRRLEPATHGFIADSEVDHSPPPVAVFRLASEFAADESQRAMHKARLAWALLIGKQSAEAADSFRAALQDDPASAGLKRGLGEALLIVKDEEGAFRTFNDVARSLGARQDYSREYWHAWTRMLEILARRPRTADEDARIRREIARLRSMDSALDHPDCMVRIKALEAQLN